MYSIELYDRTGLRLASFDDVPLLEATRTSPDDPDRILGLLPTTLERVGHTDRVRVYVDGELFCEAAVTAVRPQWSDTRKLVLERYVMFHEIVEIEAEREARWGDVSIARAYVNKSPDAIVRDAINAATGAIHYTIDHTAYPEGAQREHGKLLARKLSSNELQIDGIGTGDWVGMSRLDASGAYARDGDTIAGLVVDGTAWPDLRLMMVDTEETSKNSHAIARHPEIADWTTAQYSASAYKQSADAAKIFLQSLIDTHGIDYVELNPHRDITGAYDDRVDAYGRYIALVYGGGMCWNAALVESGHSDVYLYSDGEFHVPEMQLKDYYSYARPSHASIDASAALVAHLDFVGSLHELLTMSGYMAGGYAWHIDACGAVHFRDTARVSRVLFHEPVQHGFRLGSNSKRIVNAVDFTGNSAYSNLGKRYERPASIEMVGERSKGLRAHALIHEQDADLLVESLLDDVAYPEPDGLITFHAGDPSIRVGDVVEVRGDPFRLLEPVWDGQWADRFASTMVGRVRSVTHRFMGRRIETRAWLTSPLRSVADPIAWIVQGQPSEASLFQLRLDDANVGVDLGYHLD